MRTPYRRHQRHRFERSLRNEQIRDQTKFLPRHMGFGNLEPLRNRALRKASQQFLQAYT